MIFCLWIYEVDSLFYVKFMFIYNQLKKFYSGDQMQPDLPFLLSSMWRNRIEFVLLDPSAWKVSCEVLKELCGLTRQISLTSIWSWLRILIFSLSIMHAWMHGMSVNTNIYSSWKTLCFWSTVCLPREELQYSIVTLNLKDLKNNSTEKECHNEIILNDWDLILI